jgi:hypothetical protein
MSLLVIGPDGQRPFQAVTFLIWIADRRRKPEPGPVIPWMGSQLLGKQAPGALGLTRLDGLNRLLDQIRPGHGLYNENPDFPGAVDPDGERHFDVRRSGWPGTQNDGGGFPDGGQAQGLCQGADDELLA